MKAAKINKYGDSDVIEIKETAVPEVSEGHVLVEVFGASVNPIDYKIRLGYLAQVFPDPLAVILGADFSGVVKEIGGGVTKFNIGDEVFGNASMLNGGSGSMAEFVLAAETSTAIKPSSLDFVNSAALPLVAASAIQAIEEHINIKEGQKILIHGGAGGIGSLAIQIAKMHGAYVATTVSKEAEEFVKSLGADLVINYKQEMFEDRVSDYDAVFATTSESEVNRSLKVLKKGGILVTMGAPVDQEEAEKLGVTAISQNTKTSSDKLERIAKLVDEGKLKVEVDKEFSFKDVSKAFEYAENGHPKGKVVISIK